MAMPKLKYFLQCDEVRNEGGKFSALGIFDTIFSFIFPASHKRFFLLLGFSGGEGRYDLEVHITAPNGAVLARANGELAIAPEQQGGNTVFGFENLPLPLQGDYTVSVFLDGDFLVEHVFRAQPPFRKHDRSPEEIALLMEQPDIVKTANVEMVCDKCRTTYRFQHNLDPSAPIEKGFVGLPPGEFFICAVCGSRLAVEQLRENMQNIVGIPRQWLDARARQQQQPPQANPGPTPEQ